MEVTCDASGTWSLFVGDEREQIPFVKEASAAPALVSFVGTLQPRSNANGLPHVWSYGDACTILEEGTNNRITFAVPLRKPSESFAAREQDFLQKVFAAPPPVPDAPPMDTLPGVGPAPAVPPPQPPLAKKSRKAKVTVEEADSLVMTNARLERHDSDLAVYKLRAVAQDGETPGSEMMAKVHLSEGNRVDTQFTVPQIGLDGVYEVMLNVPLPEGLRVIPREVLVSDIGFADFRDLLEDF